MKIFFDSRKDVPKLTTMECLEMLGEERHHTDFLEPFKRDVFDFVMETIKFMVVNKQYTFRRMFTKENQYCTQLLVSITLNRRTDYSNRRHTNGAFYNDSNIVNGKLMAPEFDIEVGIGENDEVSTQWLNLIVDHEMNHLYDDWQWQTTGHERLTDNAEWNHGDGDFIQKNLGNKENKLVQALAWCVYASLWTESNSYVNQAFKEFEYVKMKPRNVHEKIKATTSYRNYSKQMIDLKWWLGKCSEEEVRSTVNGLFKTYGKISIPKPKQGEDYRERLTKWSESIYNKFMKRYCGIASLYLERNFNKFLK